MTLPSLKDEAWLHEPALQAVLLALSARDVTTRIVGGAVRNGLMGLAVDEVDLATTAMPDQVTALAEAAGLKVIPTGKAHGTVTVVAHGKGFEVTTLRKDVETDGRHAKVSFTQDWEADARRRDFTFNALYADADGTVFDPLGGYDDLLSGHVRFIGDAAARIKEDYLRILRFFRFQASYGRGPIDRDGLAACVALRGGLDGLSAERRWAETRRILIAPGVHGVIEALFDYGLLVPVLGGVPRLGRFAKLCALEETLGLEPDATLRLAALAVFVREDAGRLARHFRLSNAEEAVLRQAAERPCLGSETDARALLYRLGEAVYPEAVLMAWVGSEDDAGSAAWRALYSLPARWQVPRFPIKAGEIIALGADGPLIGKIMRRLEADWIKGGFAADHDALLSEGKALIAAETA